MISEAICVAPTGDRCGEGVLWHEAHAAVYWTDINRFLIHRLTWRIRLLRSWFFHEPVTALAPSDRDDVLAVCLGSRVILWEASSNRQLKEFFRLGCWPRARLNDGRADPCGSLWVGSMRNNVASDGSSTEAGGKDGVLYRLDPDGAVTEHRTGIGISNTVRGAPTGGISISEILWPTSYGTTILILEVSATGNLTNCTFGGHGRQTLYVTTAVEEKHKERLAGGLFVLRIENQGQLENRFYAFTIPAATISQNIAIRKV